MPADPQPPAADFDERLSAPLRWWLIGFAFVVSVFVAIAFYLGPLNGAIAAAAAGGVLVAVLIAYGRLRVSADDRALTVGQSRIEWSWVAGATALNGEESHHRLGAGADVRAHLAVRPYLKENVEVTLADPADPHPYWLVGSRRATELAAAIN
ncbi:MAG: DUF3093 domain-containing protein, partial [Propionibacteriaceae bacterium]|nr:DUF3093 domain-containing protein [Propionibacteriaceae bacterium]